VRTATAVVLLVLSLHVPAANAQGQSAEEAVTRALTCFTDSWNRHDMAAFGLCFAADVDFVNVTAQWWKGRTAIEKNHAFLHGTIEVSDTADVTVPPRSHGIFKASTLSFAQMTMRAARPDLAIARASWRMTGDTRTPEPRSGVMMVVVANDGGRWQILAVQNTEIARQSGE
jgi:ketosteroid isomerase-like protein